MNGTNILRENVIEYGIGGHAGEESSTVAAQHSDND